MYYIQEMFTLHWDIFALFLANPLRWQHIADHNE